MINFKGVLGLEEDAVAASWTVLDDRLARWQAGFDEVFGLVAGEFAQVESRRRARSYLLGLLSGAERKNSWTIAEQAGDLSPDGMQRLATPLAVADAASARYGWPLHVIDDAGDDPVLDQQKVFLDVLRAALVSTGNAVGS